MTASQYEEYQKLLLNKRTELTRARGSNGDSRHPEIGRHADIMDQSAQAVEEGVQVSLRETDSRLLKAIDSALFRIDRGTFGVCEVCTQPIPVPRLNAVPWARLCRDCKEQQDIDGPLQVSAARDSDAVAEE
jgi:DnaK suppressor protein